MSNKLVKNKPKSQSQTQSKTEINDNDPKIVKFLKGRLKNISEKNKTKEQFKSSIIYFLLEFVLFSIYYTYLREATLDEKWMYPTLILSNVFMSLYNIGISVYQIYKKKFRKVGNIILIVMHCLIIALSIYALR